MKRKNLLVIMTLVSVIFTLSIACKQSGEIITSAEATQRSEATQAAYTGDVVIEAEGAVFNPGDSAVLTSEGHLVGLFKDAGAKNPFSFATRGDTVTVTSSVVHEGVIWYKIESSAGNGWLLGSNLEAE